MSSLAVPPFHNVFLIIPCVIGTSRQVCGFFCGFWVCVECECGLKKNVCLWEEVLIRVKSEGGVL